MKLKVDGSGTGTVVTPKLQLTTELCPPLDRSARNKVHVPFGLLPLNELKNALGLVVSNNDR